MGFFDRWRAAREHDRQAEKARRDAQDRAAWQAHRDLVAQRLDTAREFRGLDHQELMQTLGGSSGLQLRKGERAFLVASNVALVEPRRGPGHYEGGSQGVSFRVAKGVRYRVGATKGTFVQGAEKPTIIDEGGHAVITDQRVVFAGPKQSREWSFAKLLGYDQDLPGTITMQVSNRQKASGVVFGHAEEEAAFRLALALAVFNDEVDEFVEDLSRQLAEVEARRPSGSVAAAEPPPTPG